MDYIIYKFFNIVWGTSIDWSIGVRTGKGRVGVGGRHAEVADRDCGGPQGCRLRDVTGSGHENIFIKEMCMRG